MPDLSDPVARRRGLAVILAVALLSGCAAENPALSPTQDADVGVSSTILLLDQVDAGSTLPTVARATASDMLSIVSEAQLALEQLPVGSVPGSVDALAAVREAADAVASADNALATGEDTGSAQAQLRAAATELSAAIDGLR